MSDHEIDYEHVRAQTERRLAPMLRLHHRRTRLLAYTFVYIMLILSAQSWLAAPYNDTIIMLISVCFALLMALTLQFIFAWRRETMMQAEMKHELEIERLRLLHGLARGTDGDGLAEKAKRSVSLSDDGELITEGDDSPAESLQQRANHREV